MHADEDGRVARLFRQMLFTQYELFDGRRHVRYQVHDEPGEEKDQVLQTETRQVSGT